MTEARAIATLILEGFDRHYRLFRDISARATDHFERRDWDAHSRDNSERIRMYDQRVNETVETLITEYPEAAVNTDIWPEVKLAYVGLLLDHLQVECAETFYNSVACHVLHRRGRCKLSLRAVLRTVSPTLRMACSLWLASEMCAD